MTHRWPTVDHEGIDSLDVNVQEREDKIGLDSKPGGETREAIVSLGAIPISFRVGGNELLPDNLGHLISGHLRQHGNEHE